jgi:hypothetical protein
VKKKHNDKHVKPFMRFSPTAFAIDFSKLDDITTSPAHQPHEVQDSGGMKIQNKQSEESIQDLVGNLKPLIPLGLLGKYSI